MRSFLSAGAALGAAALLAACSGGDAAPPEPGEGAVGMVETDNAGAAQNPQTPALSGGMAGQTPDYGQPGAAPSQVESNSPGTGTSSGSDTPPLN